MKPNAQVFMPIDKIDELLVWLVQPDTASQIQGLTSCVGWDGNSGSNAKYSSHSGTTLMPHNCLITG